MKKNLTYLLIVLVSWSSYSCTKKEGCTDPTATNYNPDAEQDDGSCIPATHPPSTDGNPTPVQIAIPAIFAQTLPAPFIPADNPLTIEGIELGRKLFFDPILSGDGTQSCATCHAPNLAFTDTNQFSTGIDGLQGDRNSMPIFNIAWNFSGKFFWDGRAPSAEAQAIGPVVNPIEMHNTWPNAMASLQAHPSYPNLFLAAFGTNVIDSTLVTKAIAQFERTLVSGNSRFDRYLLGQLALTPQEINGFNVFMAESGGDCFHCHGNSGNPLWTDNTFRNNGLDASPSDLGLGAVTGNPADNGKFKTPSLRNLVFTAPYMHDGRFKTIDEVLEHYSTGVKMSPTIDPDMQFAGQGGVQMTPQEKADLKAFLLALTDSSFITNPDYQAP